MQSEAHGIPRQAKLWKREKDQWFPGAEKEGRKDKPVEHKGIFRAVKLLYIIR